MLSPDLLYWLYEEQIQTREDSNDDPREDALTKAIITRLSEITIRFIGQRIRLIWTLNRSWRLLQETKQNR